MKTKIASLFMAAVFGVLAFATNSSAADEGFYDKDHIRGFISFGADFRGMMPGFNDYINNVAFTTSALQSSSKNDTSLYYGAAKFKKFNKFYPGLHFNVGAQYKQFLTWINFNFMITQTSERPRSTMVASTQDTSNSKSITAPLYDARWFAYGDTDHCLVGTCQGNSCVCVIHLFSFAP